MSGSVFIEIAGIVLPAGIAWKISKLKAADTAANAARGAEGAGRIGYTETKNTGDIEISEGMVLKITH